MENETGMEPRTRKRGETGALPIMHETSATPARTTGSRSIGAIATGAFALGALAMGAVAIGALAIGRLAIGRLRIRDATIDRLRVRTIEMGQN